MFGAHSAPLFLSDDKRQEDFFPLGAEDVGGRGEGRLFAFLIWSSCIFAFANTCPDLKSRRAGPGRRQVVGMPLEGTGLDPQSLGNPGSRGVGATGPSSGGHRGGLEEVCGMQAVG